MRRAKRTMESLVERLCALPGAQLVERGEYCVLVSDADNAEMKVATPTIRELLSRGLLVEPVPGRYAASAAAAAWMKRCASKSHSFRVQHGSVQRIGTDSGAEALVDLDESPIGALARHSSQGRKPWLDPHTVTAAERLRRDFELGQLQPRVTANWSASVATRRRTGEPSGLANLTEMAVAARMRFDHAMRAVGPELSGVLVDVCCFLKGLETVEREHQWPARSAKLVLRIALESLARHYGYAGEATGPKQPNGTLHWGADGYRPTVS